MMQYLEDALSYSLTLKKDVKKPYSMPLKKAYEILEGYRSYTLGRAIKIAKKEGIYPESLQQNLNILLSERNWLVHKCLTENMYFDTRKQGLFYKIKSITEKAHDLLQSIEADLIDFSLSNDLDISGVQAVIHKYHEES